MQGRIFRAKFELIEDPDTIGSEWDLHSYQQDLVRHHDVDLDDVKLNHLDFRGVSWVTASLFGSSFEFTDFEMANLMGSRIRSSRFSGANLKNTTLEYADIEYTDFSFADLSGASLQGARLIQCDLRWCDLRGANLERCEIVDVLFQGATIDENTQLPFDHSVAVDMGMTLVLSGMDQVA